MSRVSERELVLPALRIIDGPPSDPKPWIPSPRVSLALPSIIADVHRLMRRVKRDATAPSVDDWTPNYAGDCQNRVVASMLTLYMAGVPRDVMRGYTGGAYIGRSKLRWQSHAVLGVCIQAAPKPVIYVLDDQQEGIRTLHWMQTNKLYKSISPRMRMEP